MTREAARPKEGRRLVSVSARLKGGSPDAFLRLLPGAPRGFWAHGERWIVHLGAVATLECGGADPDRFHTVWAQARALFDDDGALPGRRRDRGGAPPARFFGGFSFGADHRPAGAWAHHPPARFLLPEVEITGGGAEEGGAPRMLLRAWAQRGTGRETEARLRRRIEEARSRSSIETPAESASATPARAADATLTRAADAALTRAASATPAESPSGTPARAADAPPAPSGFGAIRARVVEQDASWWEEGVRRVLSSIGARRVAKVVLARTLDVEMERAPDPVRVALRLWRHEPGTHLFLFEPVPGHPFLGASPETIATLRRGAFRATSVAGSAVRGATPAEEERLASRLMASAKDRTEHDLTVRDTLARLSRLSRRAAAEPTPHILPLSGIQHLETRIRAEVDPGRSILSLLSALHPTAAVGGLPRRAAGEFLRAEEPFDRGWYAGPVGWFDEEGGGVFAPALRAAVGAGRRWRLFAGAGIVEGSDPASEWEETGLKFRPVLRALEASGVHFERASPQNAKEHKERKAHAAASKARYKIPKDRK